MLRKSYELLQSSLHPYHPTTQYCLNKLCDLYNKWKKTEEENRYRRLLQEAKDGHQRIREHAKGKDSTH